MSTTNLPALPLLCSRLSSILSADDGPTTSLVLSAKRICPCPLAPVCTTSPMKKSAPTTNVCLVVARNASASGLTSLVVPAASAGAAAGGGGGAGAAGGRGGGGRGAK